MSKILFIIPDKRLLPYAKRILGRNYPSIEVIAAIPSEAVEVVRSSVGKGIGIIAARTMTASVLREAQINIPIVEIPRTSFDIMRAIEDAKPFGKKFAFIAYPEKIWGIDLFSEAFGINLRQYTVGLENDLKKEIGAARADGADVILGGFSIVEEAKRLGIQSSLIHIGEEALLQAAREASRIQETIDAEAAKRGVLGTILDYSNDGIITIGSDARITAFNPVAEKLTRINRSLALGARIEEILPQLDWHVPPVRTRESLQRIFELNGTKVICNRVPIVVNDKSFGAVITFQEASRIQKMEAMIRQEIYARGHVARFCFDDILGDSKAIMDATRVAKSYASTDINVLVLGETGTGKEVFAQSIHNASQRASGPFVAINCAALPTHILESELFGYVGGAFTGANKEGRPGLFEIAHGGTVFLDEIAEMDYVNQGRLLRILQEKNVVRLGSHKVIPVDVRVIAATNKPLESMVEEKKFRDDLYFRLNILNLELPALRDRDGDIALYATRFLAEMSMSSKRSWQFSAGAIAALRDYAWPGNIRELQNIVSRLAVTSTGDTIEAAHVDRVLKRGARTVSARPSKVDRLTQEIYAALEQSRGNYSAAARLMGIHRMTLRRRMVKLGIDT